VQSPRRFPRGLPACLLVLFASPGALRPAHAQPLLLIGKADAHLSGAFSYDILKSPLERPVGEGRAQLGLNLPVNVSAQAQTFLGEAADSSLVIPDFFARVSQDLNAHVDISAPVFGGTAFFAARENASLTVSGALGDARFSLDTTLEGAGAVLLKGTLHMPLAFGMRWRSLTYGYAFRPGPKVAMAFQVHNHHFSARTSGDLRPDLTGRITVSGEAANTSFLVEYPDSKVYGTARGDYQGEAWSPEMGIALGPVRIVSRMGARMRAKGYLDVDYSVPFFVDPEDFSVRFSEPDSFLAAGNLSRLLNAEVGRKVMKVREDLILTLPQSHSLSVDLWPGHVTLAYTKVFGSLAIHGASSGRADSSRPAAADSALTTTEGFADVDIRPDQVLVLSAGFGGFRLNLGAHTLNVGYRGRPDLLSGLSPLEWDGDPIVPILDFGFAWGHPLAINLDFHVSPLPAVRTGLVYAF
jgi:hypothetical protein